MKFIVTFLYYFLATFMTVALTLMLVGTAIDVFFWLFYKTPFNFSMKEVINYLKIACITGGVCGIGGMYYYARTMKRH
ncbi:hypothetical protein [Edwardsiella piscicida]|uniref:hypothetical protein n=1 Tax=Edwardsiella piscicida TaxID=1263550 RepID=UPI000AC0090F|nr:hypothetical protein [Edwardsiella piscicida]EKS7812384.1 hypothetical protein [Edwardsiella piscicida]UCQ21868.1 hypothetical protein DCE66_04025 [Edwardsiella piscicida]WAM45471.1 hypothetical protein NMC32_04100 [Edwardsiella piscicida]